MEKTSAFDLGVEDAMTKLAVSAETVARAAAKRGVSPGHLRQLARSRSEGAQLGNKIRGTVGKSRPGTAAAFSQMYDAGRSGGEGQRYLKSWLKNKPHAKKQYAEWARDRVRHGKRT